MSSRRADLLRQSSRWATSLALLALMPKCVLCVAAYVGLGAAFGLGAPELCGAPAGAPGAWTSALVAPAIALGSVGLLMRFRWRSPGCE